MVQNDVVLVDNHDANENTYPFVLVCLHINTIHDNEWTKGKYMVQNDVILVDNHDDNNNTYPFVLVHLPTIIQYLMMNGQKVSTWFKRMLFLWTIVMLMTVLTYLCWFIYPHKYNR